MRYDSILETIGRTPCVRLHKLTPKHVKLYVKLESFNPQSSVKDRMAAGIIEQAEKDGSLKPGQTVIEATSGNAGIGLAMVCAQKGYPFVAVMAENFSLERRRIMRFFGAKVVLTPSDYKGSGSLAKAKELAAAHNWFLCRQFENEANAHTHAETTGREILEDFSDLPLDYWVTGYGTGGTLKGVASVLKQHSPHTKVVVCEPNNAQLLASIESQVRNDDGSAASSHPYYQPHMMQGWTPDFISKLTEEAQKAHCIDRIMPVDGSVAMNISRKLAEKEGIFTGISGGATLAGALKLAQQAAAGSTILCMLPDSGERYLSTPLFEHIVDEMNTDEEAIANSTPNFRYDSSAPLPVIEVDEQEPLISEVTQQMLKLLVHSKKTPIILFAQEWCEICWSVRKLFKELSIPFHGIDLDSSSYRAANLGNKLKATLFEHTGHSTIPQIFVNGEFIGGTNELFDAINNRSFFRRLDTLGISYNRVKDIDPYTLLPGWLHAPSPSDEAREKRLENLEES